MAGDHRTALAYYSEVLGVPIASRYHGRIERSHHRARANIEAILNATAKALANAMK